MRTILALLALIFAVPAQAQGMCQPYAAFVKVLNGKYGETSQGKGLAGDTVVIELFASESTFTILATNTSGVACMIAAGKGWETAPKFLGDDT